MKTMIKRSVNRGGPQFMKSKFVSLLLAPLALGVLASCGGTSDVYTEDHAIYGSNATYDVLGIKEIPVGMWVTPSDDCRNEEAYKTIAESGITMVNGFYFYDNEESEIIEILGYCEKYGLKYLFASEDIEKDIKKYNEDPKDSYVDDAMSIIGKYANYPAFGGVLFIDEPSASYFDTIRVFFDKFKSLYPGKLAYVNNLASYAVAGTGYSRYEDYIDAWISKSGTNFVSYDSYPLVDYDPSQEGYECELSDYYYNLDLVRSKTLKKGLPMWTFVSTCGFKHATESTRRTPSREDIRWSVFSNLAFGSKGLQYFCYFTPGQDTYGEAMITRGGAKTERYDYVKEVDTEIKTYSASLLNADAVGVMMSDYRRNGYDLYGQPLSKFGPVKSVEGNLYVAGCFQDKDNGNKSMLISPTTPRDSIDITLNMYSSVKTVSAVVGGEDKQLTVDNGKLNLKIEKGDAVYIRF